jgi:hypothetical protein
MFLIIETTILGNNKLKTYTLNIIVVAIWTYNHFLDMHSQEPQNRAIIKHQKQY